MRRLVISYILPMTHNFKVYPNPVSETLFIETDGYEAAYELFDSSGIIIQSGDISGTNELDMKNIVPGIYNLRITDGNDIVVMKILKQ